MVYWMIVFPSFGSRPGVFVNPWSYVHYFELLTLSKSTHYGARRNFMMDREWSQHRVDYY